MTDPEMLNLAKGFELPTDAVTETFAVLGRRGSGKTHTASVLAEEMLNHALRIVVLDPLDVWFGLRSSADGKSPGFPIVVFGGAHGDVPLVATAGALLADVITEEGLSAILSVRHLSKSDQRRFVGDFAERLYERKGESKHRDPLHLIVDEADAFVPQRILPGGERAYGAIDTLVRRGRSSGVGTTLISQRAAVIAKDVLTQTEALVCHQTTGPQDRKALEAWIEANDDENRRGEFMGSLASLKRGEAWFWSPSWLRLFRKVQVRPRTTFDSSSTPKVGSVRAAPQKLAPVDLAALRGRITDTIEKAKADDPKALRARIAELERQLREGAPPNPATAFSETELMVLRENERYLGSLGQPLAKIAAALPETLKELEIAALAIRTVLEMAAKRRPTQEYSPRVAPEPRARQSQETAVNGAPSGLGKCERALLTAWAQHGRLTLTQACIIAGYSTASSGPSNAASRLRSLGYVSGGNTDGVEATRAGVQALGNYNPLPVGRALAEYWLGELGKCEAAILRQVLKAYPGAVSLEKAARAEGYSTESSGPGNAASKLRTLALVHGGNSGMVADERLIG